MELMNCVIHQGTECTLVAKVHVAHEVSLDIFGMLAPHACLQDYCSKDYGAFGIPGVGACTMEFCLEDGQESMADSAMGHRVAW